MEKKEIILKLQGPSLLLHLLRREAVYPNFAISSKQAQLPFLELHLASTSCFFSTTRIPSFPFDFRIISQVFCLLWPLFQLKVVTLLPEIQTGCHLPSITISFFSPPGRMASLADKGKHLSHKSGAELMYLLYLPILLFLGDVLV